jgi:hypothetical protein
VAPAGCNALVQHAASSFLTPTECHITHFENLGWMDISKCHNSFHFSHFCPCKGKRRLFHLSHLNSCSTWVKAGAFLRKSRPWIRHLAPHLCHRRGANEVDATSNPRTGCKLCGINSARKDQKKEKVKSNVRSADMTTGASCFPQWHVGQWQVGRLPMNLRCRLTDTNRQGFPHPLQRSLSADSDASKK